MNGFQETFLLKEKVTLAGLKPHKVSILLACFNS